MATLSKSDIQLIAKEVAQQIAQQDLGQTGQQGDQQLSDQIEKGIAQAAQASKQSSQGTSQEKSSVVDIVTQNKQEETNTGEAHRGKTYVDSEMWGLNKKLVTEREQRGSQNSQDQDLALKSIAISEAKLELARKEHDFGHKQQLDHVALIAQTNAGMFNTAIQFEYARFNNASADPISPNGVDEKVLKATK